MTMFRDDAHAPEFDQLDADRPEIDLRPGADLEPPTDLARTDVEPGFAARSAEYLASCGLTADDIETALVQQLGLRPSAARRVVGHSIDWFPSA